MKKFNVGIVGCGWAAEAHIAALNATSNDRVAGSHDGWARAFGVVTVPDNAGKLVILLKAEHQLSDVDTCWFDNVGGAGPQISKRYERVVPDVELKAGTNTIEVGDTKLLNPIIAPLSNGSDFPADIAAGYRLENPPCP
jgi:hypothetical protein